jgi:hypothetical protein
MDELARILLQKEGEPAKDSVVQTRTPAGGKRAIGKAVAKGGLLLKGKNPGNVPPLYFSSWSYDDSASPTLADSASGR